MRPYGTYEPIYLSFFVYMFVYMYHTSLFNLCIEYYSGIYVQGITKTHNDSHVNSFNTYNPFHFPPILQVGTKTASSTRTGASARRTASDSATTRDTSPSISPGGPPFPGVPLKRRRTRRRIRRRRRKGRRRKGRRRRRRRSTPLPIGRRSSTSDGCPSKRTTDVAAKSVSST